MTACPVKSEELKMQKTWLVTGAAGGLGRAIIEHALANGDQVVATARQPEKLSTLQAQYESRIAIAALDVTDADGADAAVERAIDVFGRLDVLVNNAGFAKIAPFEQTSPEDFQAQIDTNFNGVINLTRAALPTMRQQRSGHIINISSGAGRIGAAGMSAYSAAKFAVGGFTESLAKEVATFGVQVIAVEPGSMQTNWASFATTDTADVSSDYQVTVGHNLAVARQLAGNEIGDLQKFARVIFVLSRRNELPNHLLLGSDALFVARRGDTARDKAAAEWEAVSRSTDREGADLSFLSHVAID
jgi:NAD(P)-dependent dehydrogenase (short-subunit alcohol dehydrogenase family)